MSDSETIGSELRAARESRELTLDQAERQTRIRAHYLEALEQGNYSALPSAVQGRGFLRNYARFLGLDGDVFVARFDMVLRGGGSRRSHRQSPIFPDDPTLQSASRRTVNRDGASANTTQQDSRRSRRVTSRDSSTSNTYNAATPAPSNLSIAERSTHTPPIVPTSAEARQRRNRNMTLGTLAIIGASAVALIILIVYSTQPAATSTPSPILSPLPTQNGITDTPESTATRPRPTPLPNPNGSATPAVMLPGGLTIQITVKERAILWVSVDGASVYNDVAAPDTVLQYQAKDSIKIHSGNAGGLQIIVNGVEDILGQRHEIVDKTYTASSPPKPISQALPTQPVQSSPPTKAARLASSPSSSARTQSITFTASPLATFASPLSLSATVAAPTLTSTAMPRTSTPKPSQAPSGTLAPSRTPSGTPTPSLTLTASRTPIFLPHETSTPDSRAN